jgi:hypothetical protein
MKWVVIDIDGVKETIIETEDHDPSDADLIAAMKAAGITITGTTVGFGELDDGSLIVYDSENNEDLYTIEPEDDDEDYL